MTQNAPEITPLAPPSNDEIAQAVLAHVQQYAQPLAELGVVHTPLEPSPDTPAAEMGYRVWIKDDCEQPINAFKLRGAGIALLHALDTEQTSLRDGSPRNPRELPRLEYAVAATRGNHGQGVAYAAAKLSLTALIETTEDISPAKLQALEALGAKVRFHPTLEDAREAADTLGAQPGYACIDPFDMIPVMAGGGTVGQEIILDTRRLHAEGEIDVEHDDATVLLASGGGGLGSGAAVAIKAVNPHMRVVLVQMEGCDAIGRTLRNEPPLTRETLDASCDGTAVLKLGRLTLPIIADRRYVDEVISVPKSLLGQTMRHIYEQTGHIVEPAGALAEAGATFLAQRQGAAPPDGRRHHFMAFRSGGNMLPADFGQFLQDAMTPAERLEAVKHLSNRSPRQRKHPTDVSRQTSVWGAPTGERMYVPSPSEDSQAREAREQHVRDARRKRIAQQVNGDPVRTRKPL